METSVLIGNNIQLSNDLLSEITIENLFEKIQNPKNSFIEKIERLNTLSLIDVKKYKELKKTLPYFICAFCEPRYRKLANFSYIEHFVIDIDNICDQLLDIDDLKKKLSNDERVKLIFKSPSGNGLKLMFQLDKRCFDYSLYSVFYHRFAEEFSKQYGLSEMIDTCCSDATRACFLSYDKDTYINNNSFLIPFESYVSDNNSLTLISEAKHMPTDVEEIKPETFDFIKSRLNPKVFNREQVKKQIFVPDELNDIINGLVEFIIQSGIDVAQVIDINYGKQLKLSHENLKAEVNLFYGRNGFHSVESPRNGTNLELSHLSKLLIDTFLLNNRLIA